MKKTTIRIIIVLCITGLAVLADAYFSNREKNDHIHEKFRVAICLKGHRSPDIHFSTGFNYEILRGFAGKEELEHDFFLATDWRTYLDSLATDSLDVIVMPAKDTVPEGFIVSRVHADSSVWVCGVRHRNFMNLIEEYFDGLESDGSMDEMRQRFKPSYEPYARIRRGGRYASASPYDELLKKHAKTLGWDWRMLCALVWQESRFHIEARSRSGAEGLMQMIPKTAGRFGNRDMLDPEANIETGVKYLSRLQKMFRRHTSGEDLMWFTLAAYNAGEGRIMDCINYAKGHGKPHSTWADIEEVIPHLRDKNNIDSTVVLGVFKGYETLRYIKATESLYHAFCKIAPGEPTGSAPSSQGRLSRQKDKESEEAASQPDTLRNQQ